MARAAAKPKKEVSMEEALWKSADKLRGSVEPAEYKHVVLSLFFLKFASDKFEAQRKKLIAAGYEAQIEKTFAYTKDNVFYLPPESRWSYIMENAKQDDIALKIDTALYTIEKTNPALKGALPDNYYSRLAIDTNKLASLLDEIDKINTDDEENDIIGRVYEYFLGKFALAEGKGKGEYQRDTGVENVSRVDGYDDFIFVNRFGQVQHQGTLNKAIKRIMRDCNDEVIEKEGIENDPVLLPNFSCHTLRHTFATRLCESGINVKVIQDVLGHADISTTMDIYVDVMDELKKREIASFDSYMAKSRETI